MPRGSAVTEPLVRLSFQVGAAAAQLSGRDNERTCSFIERERMDIDTPVDLSSLARDQKQASLVLSYRTLVSASERDRRGEGTHTV